MTKYITVLLFSLFISCTNYGQLTYITKLPKKLEENSGMAIGRDSTVWLVNDSGGADKIYQINFEGKYVKQLEVKNAKNKDWEDMTRDKDGNFYIADTGNNANKRKDLVIYKIPDPEKEKGDKIKAEQIEFYYPEQKKFPPKQKNLLYDAEAIFYAKDSLYLITKNRSHPFNGKALIYRIPAKKGKYEATFLGTFIPCTEFSVCKITAADISPDGKTIALLGYGKLWLFTNFELSKFFDGELRTIDLGIGTQLESISFLNNKTLLLSDEQLKHRGRNLYSYNIIK
ncbi:hypothetical protein [uncultured Eudoraea sp.]|uniref:hypothetical protein n=1 Tax=uncultured Eudoraea sp. TaxID=1035614 RepID=UPI0026122050|nr:hypothetical protein [uncultured Eudoraea sp.]